MPFYGIALTEGTAPWEVVVPKSRGANLRRDPPGLVPLRTWASHPIMSRHGEPCRGASSPLPPGT